MEVSIGYNAANIADILTTLGVSQGALNMGAFSGSTIPDNQNTKQAIQALETQLESIGSASGDITGVLDVLAGGVLTLRQAATDFTSNDATPEITRLIYRCNYTVSTTITDFDGTLYDGQLLIVYFDEDMSAKPTIDLTASGIEAYNRSADYTVLGGEVLMFMYSTNDSQWHALNIPDEIASVSQNGFIRNDSGTPSATELSGAVTTSGSGVTTITAGAVKSSHVDWGTGAGQIALDDIPGGVAPAQYFNFSSASGLSAPAGAAPTVDTLGKFGVDSTADQFLFYTNRLNVLSPIQYYTVVIENLAAADDNYEIGMFGYPVEIVSIGVHCRGTCTTAAQISLEDRAGNAMAHTTPTASTGTNVTTFQLVTAANTLTAGEGFAIDVDNAVSPETDEYTITVGYRVTQQ